jgi:hypothetical protein
MTGGLKFINCGRMGQHKYHETPISKHCHVFPASQQQTHMQELGNCWKYCSPSSLVRVYGVVVAAAAVVAVAAPAAAVVVVVVAVAVVV